MRVRSWLLLVVSWGACLLAPAPVTAQEAAKPPPLPLPDASSSEHSFLETALWSVAGTGAGILLGAGFCGASGCERGSETSGASLGFGLAGGIPGTTHGSRGLEPHRSSPRRFASAVGAAVPALFLSVGSSLRLERRSKEVQYGAFVLTFGLVDALLTEWLLSF